MSAGSSPAQAIARRAATVASSIAGTCEMRRSFMPVRLADPRVVGVEERGEVGVGQHGRRHTGAPTGDGGVRHGMSVGEQHDMQCPMGRSTRARLTLNRDFHCGRPGRHRYTPSDLP